MSSDTDLRGRSLARRLHVIATTYAVTMAAGAAAAQVCVAGTLLSNLAEVAQVNAGVILANQMAFSIDDIEGIAGQEIPVRITLPPSSELASSDAGSGAFILIRNIPAGARLSAGMANGRLWVLPLQDVAGLRLMTQPGLVGKFTIEFNLIGTSNKRLGQQTAVLNLLSFDAGQVPTTGALQVPEGFARGQEKRPPVNAAPRPSREETMLLERGEEVLRQGGLAAARIIFEELARKGSARGALALARSYDPAHMPNPRTSSVAPDMTKALEWYRRAEELGSPEARARIAEIGSRR